MNLSTHRACVPQFWFPGPSMHRVIISKVQGYPFHVFFALLIVGTSINANCKQERTLENTGLPLIYAVCNTARNSF